jgi:hypothetical protein
MSNGLKLGILLSLKIATTIKRYQVPNNDRALDLEDSKLPLLTHLIPWHEMTKGHLQLPPQYIDKTFRLISFNQYNRLCRFLHRKISRTEGFERLMRTNLVVLVFLGLGKPAKPADAQFVLLISTKSVWLNG